MALMLEANRALVLRFVDEIANGVNGQKPPRIDDLVAPDFVDHDAPSDQAPGPEGVKRTLAAVGTGLGNFRVTTEDIIAEGDRVVTRHSAEATHQGMFMGFAPTGRRLRWSAISIYRIADGRIAERWGLLDYRGLVRQLET
jgi:predicted ester cyclase